MTADDIDLLQVAAASEPINASHHGQSKEVAKEKAAQTPQRASKRQASASAKEAPAKRKADQQPSAEDTCKNVCSRAYHQAKTQAARDGKTAEQAKAIARLAHQAAKDRWVAEHGGH